jgi:hypothetical protein
MNAVTRPSDTDETIARGKFSNGRKSLWQSAISDTFQVALLINYHIANLDPEPCTEGSCAPKR